MIFRHFASVESDAAVLLGAPLSTGEALTLCLEARCAELSLAIERLVMVNKHDALILLMCSISSPKLFYKLRCGPCMGSALLDKYDAPLHHQHRHDRDPVDPGVTTHQTRGSGNQKCCWLALSAFLASAAGTRITQASMLGESFTDTDGVLETLSLRWSEESQSPIPEGDCA